MTEDVELESIESTEMPHSDSPLSTAPAGALALSALALAGCGGGGGDGGSTATATPTPTPTPTSTSTPTPTPTLAALDPADMAAARFLLQAQFSTSDPEITAVRQKGYATWLNEQFDLPLSQKAWDWMVERGYSEIDLVNHYYTESYPAFYAVYKQLWSAPDAVRKRCALALSEFFVINFAGLVNARWPGFQGAHFWDLLNTNAFGNYRQLLEDVTLSPAMGIFLNTRGNEKENQATGRLPDENYAREVMQLFSIGLYELNIDGTTKKNPNGNPIETYTASEVSNLARVFTGYEFDLSPGTVTIGTEVVNNIETMRLPMRVNANKHSTLSINFLGVTIPANTPGSQALPIALDTLFNHPNVGPFLGRQMIQRLVTSNPSPAYVARVASVFNNNGTGVRGDLRAMFRAILLDDEARNDAGLTSTTFGKLRETMIRYIQWGRTFRINSLQRSWKVVTFTNPNAALNQYAMQAPSVFNFFRPGYVPPSTAMAVSGATAPEFQLVNESSVSQWINHMESQWLGEVNTNNPGTPSNVGTANYVVDLVVDYGPELALVLDPPALVRRLNLLLCAGQLSAVTETLIANALATWGVTAATADIDKRRRVAQAVFFVMASAEYLIQK